MRPPGDSPVLARGASPGIQIARGRRLVLIFLAIVVASASSLSIAHQAFATAFPGVCPHGGNPDSTGCLNNGTQMIAMFATWNNDNTICSGCTHINNEMWGYTNTNETRWVEIGLRNGFDNANPCQCQAYEVFWADYDPTTNTE